MHTETANAVQQSLTRKAKLVAVEVIKLNANRFVIDAETAANHLNELAKQSGTVHERAF